MQKKYLILAFVILGAGTFLALHGSPLPELRAILAPGSDGVVVDAGATARYESDRFGYSVEYPSDLKVVIYDEGEDGRTLLFEPLDPAAGRSGFQVFISPFAQDSLTFEDVRAALPHLSIAEPQVALLGDGTEALIFFTEDARVGRTREAWFARGGWLYEVSTYAERDAWLAGILQTWRFND